MPVWSNATMTGHGQADVGMSMASMSMGCQLRWVPYTVELIHVEKLHKVPAWSNSQWGSCLFCSPPCVHHALAATQPDLL